MTVFAVIPARGGSKRIERKNIRLCAGRPLISFTCRAAVDSEVIDTAVVSTDDPEIAEVAATHGVEAPFVRPPALSSDDAATLPVVQHALAWYRQAHGEPRAVVLLQPTSPLRTARHVDECVRLFDDAAASSVVSVVEVPHRYHPLKLLRTDARGALHAWSDGAPEPGTAHGASYPRLYARNGPAIVVTAPANVDQGRLYGTPNIPYVMAPEDSIDIDTPFDLRLAELLLMEREDARS